MTLVKLKNLLIDVLWQPGMVLIAAGTGAVGPVEPLFSSEEYGWLGRGIQLSSGEAIALGDFFTWIMPGSYFPLRALPEEESASCIGRLRRVWWDEDEDQWLGNARLLYRRDDLPAEFDLIEGTYATAEHFDDVPLTWVEGSAHCLLPARSSVRFGV